MLFSTIKLLHNTYLSCILNGAFANIACIGIVVLVMMTFIPADMYFTILYVSQRVPL